MELDTRYLVGMSRRPRTKPRPEVLSLVELNPKDSESTLNSSHLNLGRGGEGGEYTYSVSGCFELLGWVDLREADYVLFFLVWCM